MQKIAYALTLGSQLKPPPGNVCKTSVQRCTPTLDTTKLLIKWPRCLDTPWCSHTTWLWRQILNLTLFKANNLSPLIYFPIWIPSFMKTLLFLCFQILQTQVVQKLTTCFLYDIHPLSIKLSIWSTTLSRPKNTLI